MRIVEMGLAVSLAIVLPAALLLQGSPSAAATEKQKSRKSGSLVIYDYEGKKPGALKAKGAGKAIEEGGRNTFTHKQPSGGKVQKKPETSSRVKTRFPWLP
jgi:hypothetical protein